MGSDPVVSIVMGSKSDWETIAEAGKVLDQFNVPYEYLVTSAHRSPERTVAFARDAAARGIKVIIAGAGAAAHLAGVIASYTLLPVIGIPLDSSPLQGIDALLSTVQMPQGVPVATMAIGKAGVKNAALFALRILALEDQALREQLAMFASEQAAAVETSQRQLMASLKP